ncbi:MAG: hypothetical protein H0X51_01575 [Parachlamydiaceae bacterium]|nr:hypothetical protein [Parachlamydiaceae bacterium]
MRHFKLTETSYRQILGIGWRALFKLQQNGKCYIEVTRLHDGRTTDDVDHQIGIKGAEGRIMAEAARDTPGLKKLNIRLIMTNQAFKELKSAGKEIDARRSTGVIPYGIESGVLDLLFLIASAVGCVASVVFVGYFGIPLAILMFITSMLLASLSFGGLTSHIIDRAAAKALRHHKPL